ncbi:MAG: hypothetical protein LBT50_08780 [Prevotellaceae bacterium]|nr:hypothetical protein [Prevotellaceae bacterium]
MGQAPLLVVVVVVMITMAELPVLLPTMGLAPLLQQQKTHQKTQKIHSSPTPNPKKNLISKKNSKKISIFSL